MGGRVMRSGRPPKPDGQKRNHHKPTHDWTLLPRAGRKGRIPDLPKGRQYDFLPATVAWWKQIWRTPMATQWEPSDVHALIELALLRDALLRGKTSVAAEVRIREAEFGLTLAGRRALRWVLEDEIDKTPEAPRDELAAQRERRSRIEAAVEG